MTVRIPRFVLIVVLLAALVGGVGYGGYTLGKNQDGDAGTTTATVAGAQSPGASAGFPAPEAQRDWDIRRGDSWALYKARFKTGFDDGCTFAFVGGNGYEPAGDVMYDESGKSYGLEDCRKAFPSDMEQVYIPPFPPDDPGAEGLARGGEAGCEAIILSINAELHGTSLRSGKPITLDMARCAKQFRAGQ